MFTYDGWMNERFNKEEDTSLIYRNPRICKNIGGEKVENLCIDAIFFIGKYMYIIIYVIYNTPKYYTLSKWHDYGKKREPK